MVKLLKSKYNKRVNIYSQRIIFDNLKLGCDTIGNWYIRVKHVAARCKFSTSLTKRFQDKFIVGLRAILDLNVILDRLCEETPEKKCWDELFLLLQHGRQFWKK